MTEFMIMRYPMHSANSSYTCTEQNMRQYLNKKFRSFHQRIHPSSTSSRRLCRKERIASHDYIVSAMHAEPNLTYAPKTEILRPIIYPTKTDCMPRAKHKLSRTVEYSSEFRSFRHYTYIYVVMFCRANVSSLLHQRCCEHYPWRYLRVASLL